MKNSLSKRIWKTKKSRIEASARLNLNEKISQILLIYYSILLIAISIYNYSLIFEKYSLLVVIGSILVFSISLYVYSNNFKGRSLEFRTCYLKLDALYQISKNLDEKDEKLEGYAKQYNDFLAGFENHSEFDYLKFRYTLGQKKDKNAEDIELLLSRSEKNKYFRYKISNLLFISTIFLFPLFLFLLFIL